jgi:hypothetical protein
MCDGPSCPDCRGIEAARAFSICHRRGFVAALQDCIVQIGRMRFAWIERDNHALDRDIDCYVLNSGNVLQHRSQFAHAFIAIFTLSRDFDRFQNRVVGAFRKKRIGRIGISRSCRVHSVFFVLNVTRQLRVAVAFTPSALTPGVQPGGTTPSARQPFQRLASQTPAGKAVETAYLLWFR